MQQQQQRFGANELIGLTFAGNFLCRFKESVFQSKRYFGHNVQSDAQLNRDFLAQLWISDRKMEKSREKRRRRFVKNKNSDESMFDSRPFGRWFSGAAVTEEKPFDKAKPTLHQPPVSQAISGLLKPASPEEVNLCRYFAINVLFYDFVPWLLRLLWLVSMLYSSLNEYFLPLQH